MLVTNGKKIVLLPYDETKLQDIAKTLSKRAKDVLGLNKVKFEFFNSPYPYLENTKEFSFDELKKLCVPDMDIQFRALGPEKVQLPSVKIKDIRHEFTVDEKTLLATTICEAQADKEKTETAKALANKGYKEQLDSLEATISESSKKYREGYEIQSREVHLHLDFENKVRVYTDKDTGAILHTEELQPQDYQTKLELKESGELVENELTEEEKQNGGNTTIIKAKGRKKKPDDHHEEETGGGEEDEDLDLP